MALQPRADQWPLSKQKTCSGIRSKIKCRSIRSLAVDLHRGDADFVHDLHIKALQSGYVGAVVGQ